MIARNLYGFLLMLLTVATAEAHEIRPGFLDIQQQDPTTYIVVWKSPMVSGRPLPIEPVYADNCRAVEQEKRTSSVGALMTTFSLNCETSILEQRIDFLGLDSTLTDVLVRLRLSDGALQTHRATPDTPMVVFSSEADALATGRSVSGTYFVLGVEHILLGFDHLLFVFALVLLISGVRRLVTTITAFTLAHSVTLAAAALGWVSFPVAPVEAVIALSIVFLANEIACKQSDQARLSERSPWLVALVFGLLHGFGFAGALAEIGLPKDEIPLALLMFNLGVEAGQLLFLMAVLVILAAVVRLHLRARFERIASYVVGITASVWLLQRVV